MFRKDVQGSRHGRGVRALAGSGFEAGAMSPRKKARKVVGYTRVKRRRCVSVFSNLAFGLAVSKGDFDLGRKYDIVEEREDEEMLALMESHNATYRAHHEAKAEMKVRSDADAAVLMEAEAAAKEKKKEEAKKAAKSDARKRVGLPEGKVKLNFEGTNNLSDNAEEQQVMKTPSWKCEKCAPHLKVVEDEDGVLGVAEDVVMGEIANSDVEDHTIIEGLGAVGISESTLSPAPGELRAAEDGPDRIEIPMRRPGKKLNH